MEESDGTAGGFIREELGEGEAGMVIDGDVEELPACAAGMIALAVAGDAVAGAHDAGELLDVEMEQIARVCALVAADGRRRRESGQPRRVAAQQAGDGGLGELGGTGDLEARQLAAAQGQDARDAQGVDGPGGTIGGANCGRAARRALGTEAGQPLVGACAPRCRKRRRPRRRAGGDRGCDGSSRLDSTA